MKKILVILLCAASFCCKAQTSTQITVDSLSSIIKTMQKQITELQKIDTIAFDLAQMTLTRQSPASQFLTIKNYSAVTSTGTLTTQLNAAIVRITALETALKALDIALKALQTKVTGLKAVSTTTTLIQ